MNNLTEDRKQYLIERLATRARSLEFLEKEGAISSAQQETLDAFRIAIAALTGDDTDTKRRAFIDSLKED